MSIPKMNLGVLLEDLESDSQDNFLESESEKSETSRTTFKQNEKTPDYALSAKDKMLKLAKNNDYKEFLKFNFKVLKLLRKWPLIEILTLTSGLIGTLGAIYLFFTKIPKLIPITIGILSLVSLIFFLFKYLPRKSRIKSIEQRLISGQYGVYKDWLGLDIEEGKYNLSKNDAEYMFSAIDDIKKMEVKSGFHISTEDGTNMYFRDMTVFREYDEYDSTKKQSRKVLKPMFDGLVAEIIIPDEIVQELEKSEQLRNPADAMKEFENIDLENLDTSLTGIAKGVGGFLKAVAKDVDTELNQLQNVVITLRPRSKSLAGKLSSMIGSYAEDIGLNRDNLHFQYDYLNENFVFETFSPFLSKETMLQIEAVLTNTFEEIIYQAVNRYGKNFYMMIRNGKVFIAVSHVQETTSDKMMRDPIGATLDILINFLPFSGILKWIRDRKNKKVMNLLNRPHYPNWWNVDYKNYRLAGINSEFICLIYMLQMMGHWLSIDFYGSKFNRHLFNDNIKNLFYFNNSFEDMLYEEQVEMLKSLESLDELYQEECVLFDEEVFDFINSVETDNDFNLDEIDFD